MPFLKYDSAYNVTDESLVENVEASNGRDCEILSFRLKRIVPIPKIPQAKK